MDLAQLVQATITVSRLTLTSLSLSTLAFFAAIAGLVVATRRTTNKNRNLEIAIFAMIALGVGLSLILRYGRLFGWWI
jgi:uncharacterized membrane-anchored protein YitT (DUF2179 family)